MQLSAQSSSASIGTESPLCVSNPFAMAAQMRPWSLLQQIGHFEFVALESEALHLARFPETFVDLIQVLLERLLVDPSGLWESELEYNMLKVLNHAEVEVLRCLTTRRGMAVPAMDYDGETSLGIPSKHQLAHAF